MWILVNIGFSGGLLGGAAGMRTEYEMGIAKRRLIADGTSPDYRR
jgi:hypothetical protein